MPDRVRHLGLVVVAFLVAGAGAGVLWERLWQPPVGLAYGKEWFLEPAGPDLSFQGVALFVLIAFPLGLVLATVVGTVLHTAAHVRRSDPAGLRTGVR